MTHNMLHELILWFISKLLINIEVLVLFKHFSVHLEDMLYIICLTTFVFDHVCKRQSKSQEIFCHYYYYNQYVNMLILKYIHRANNGNNIL